MKITLTAVPDSNLSKNRRRSLYYQKEAKLIRESRDSAYLLALNEVNRIKGWKTLESCVIKVVYYYPSVPPDYEGISAMVAPIIDGIVDAGVMVDDNPNVVKEYSIKMEKVKTRKERRALITVESI